MADLHNAAVKLKSDINFFPQNPHGVGEAFRWMQTSTLHDTVPDRCEWNRQGVEYLYETSTAYDTAQRQEFGQMSHERMSWTDVP